MRRWLLYSVFFVAGAAIAVMASWTFYERPPGGGAPPPLTSDSNADVSRGRESAIVQAVDRASDAVVSIGVKRRPRLSELRRPTVWDQFLSSLVPSSTQPTWDVASGVIVDDSGLILTNEHVVRDAEDWWVVLSDGRYFEASAVGLLGADPYYDLAVLKVDGDLTGMAAPLGKSETLMVGEWVIAIGNPFGFYLADPRPSVTVGVVSALGREIVAGEGPEAALRGDTEPVGIYKNMIQTDAAINPGNSGGALANAAGEVIGINTFILSTSGGNMGLGFALPIDIATRVMDDIVEHGRARHPWTGILRVVDVTPRHRHEANIRSTSGVIVLDLVAGSPAAEAGVRPLDVIVSVNGRRVRNAEEANRAIFGSQIGERLTLGIEREGREREVTFALGERPATQRPSGSRERRGGPEESQP